MSFRIVRNDITKMNTEAIVNTANEQPIVGTGCDRAVYEAAGFEELLAYRRRYIGAAREGDAFITPGFGLPARFIIHTVSPLYIDGKHGEEEKLRSCYQKSLALAKENGIRSIAFPLISTGGFGYPKEEGMRIAVDEIHAFLLHADMQVMLVVFDERATRMGRNLYPDLEAYIDRHYVAEKRVEEYSFKETAFFDGWADKKEQEALKEFHSMHNLREEQAPYPPERKEEAARRPEPGRPEPPRPSSAARPPKGKAKETPKAAPKAAREAENAVFSDMYVGAAEPYFAETIADEDAAIEEMERRLSERIAHRADTFSQYLFYLIKEKGLENADVYKRAIVDKKVFSKIKKNPGYHPQKLTALCLCIGAKLNMDETRDLLARAGYALSPCDKTDIIFSYFIENGIYDMIDLDIQLEAHGLPCIIE